MFLRFPPLVHTTKTTTTFNSIPNLLIGFRFLSVCRGKELLVLRTANSSSSFYFNVSTFPSSHLPDNQHVKFFFCHSAGGIKSHLKDGSKM